MSTNTLLVDNLFTYAGSSPTQFRDQTGLLRIECEECIQIDRAIRNVQLRIHFLRTTGTASTPEGHPGQDVAAATTTCFDWADVDRMFAHKGVETKTTRGPGGPAFPESPCVFLCIGEHERVHRKMCRELGPSVLMDQMTEPEQELPAYETEKRCLFKAKQDGSLDLTRQGVDF